MRNKIALLVLIFLTALLLRTVHLGAVPYSMHADEVVNTFVGRYILLHGQDPRGNFLPVFYFDKFGDYPPVLPMYLSGIATFIFGINEFASRIPAALFGSLLIIPVYAFTRRLFNAQTGLFAALATAILPWHIVLSRASAEGIIALTVCMFGLLFLLQGLQDNKQTRILVSVMLLALTYLLYPSFRLLVPLLVLPFFFLFPKHKQKRTLLLTSVFFIGLTLIISSTSWGKGRFTQTSVFTNKNVITGIALENQIFSNTENDNNIFLTRVFHNKLTGYFWTLTGNYFRYFSPEYLFLNGGLPQRYAVPKEGLLLLGFVIMLLAAIVFPKKEQHQYRLLYYLLYLLVISPLPAALTIDDSPNLHRSLFMIIPLVILAGAGCSEILTQSAKQQYWKRTVLYSSLLGIFLLQLVYFWHQYSVHQTSTSSFLRNDGNKELAYYLQNNHLKYEKVYTTALLDFSPYYLFYTNNFQPRNFGAMLTVKHVDNIIFLPQDCPAKELAVNQEENILVINSGQCKEDENYDIQTIISRKDGTKAFTILTPKLRTE